MGSINVGFGDRIVKLTTSVMHSWWWFSNVATTYIDTILSTLIRALTLKKRQ